MTGARGRLAAGIDAIEGAYEFFLAYAAQGLGRGAEGTAGSAQGELRRHLDAMRRAVARLDGILAELAEEDGDLPFGTQLHAFREVVRVDAARATAALDLVAAQSFASSQLVDNLNASVHLRALLTDLFLLDEVLELGVAGEGDPTPSASEAGTP